MNRRHLLLAAAALLFAVFAVRYRAYLIDDAYISLRYSLNLVEGHGLVFNPGERVEGYTNFLWVLLGAAFLAPGIDAMTALKVVSVLASGVLVAVLLRLEKRVGRGPLPAILWLLLLESWGYWGTTGMETMLFAASLGAGLVLAVDEGRDGRFRGSAVCFLTAALTRPEGVLAFGLGALVSFGLARVHRGVWAWRSVLRDAAVFGLPGTLYFVWRWRYFGDLLPNTFHAKVTGGWEQWRNGFLNLGQWSLHHPLFALAILLPAVILATPHRGRLRERPELLALWGFTVCWVGYVVSVGGDFMPFWRFFVALLVPCAVLLGGVWKVLAEIRPGLAAAPVAALAVAVHLVANLWSEEPYRAFVAHRTTVVGEEVGRYFAGVLAADEWLAVNTAGSLPYASRRPTIDMLGLTDRQIARHPVYVVSLGWAGHRRGWGEYVVARRPRAVVWYNSAGLAEPHYLGDHQLADNAIFRFWHRPSCITSSSARIGRSSGTSAVNGICRPSSTRSPPCGGVRPRPAGRAIRPLCGRSKRSAGRRPISFSRGRSTAPAPCSRRPRRLDRSLFLAVHAQQEALRHAPDNKLYRRNLANLLRVPFKEFRDKRTGPGKAPE
jgi:hypothetical protein